MELNNQETNLIEFIKKIKYGKITVVVQNGIPIRLEASYQQINLSQPLDEVLKSCIIELD